MDRTRLRGTMTKAPPSPGVAFSVGGLFSDMVVEIEESLNIVWLQP